MSRYPNDANQAGNYTGGTTNSNEYQVYSGVCILPLAEDPPVDALELSQWSPVVTLQLHAPFRSRTFVQSSTKERNPPPIPATGDTGAFVFTGGTISVVNALNSTYQDLNWTTVCQYNYVEACTSMDAYGQPLGLVLGKLPFNSVIDRFNERFGVQPPSTGAVSLAGKSVVSGFYQGATILAPGNVGELAPKWSYNSQAFFPAELFYSDLANGGRPVVAGG